MRVIRASLVVTTSLPATDSGVSLVHDLLWAHAVHTDRLEHIRAKPADHGMNVFLFMRAASDSEAMGQVRALLKRARSPLLAQGYNVEGSLL